MQPEMEQHGSARGSVLDLEIQRNGVIPKLFASILIHFVGSRDPTRETEHPLAAITYCMDQAIRKQVKWGARCTRDKNAASQERVLWRAFSDTKISDEFKEFGGTDFAPMSTTTDVRLAVNYAIRKMTTGGELLMRQ